MWGNKKPETPQAQPEIKNFPVNPPPASKPAAFTTKPARRLLIPAPFSCMRPLLHVTSVAGQREPGDAHQGGQHRQRDANLQVFNKA